MQLSDAEWIVMNRIWDTQPVEANDIIDGVAAEHQWTAATVKTMLHRLVKKGALEPESVGKRYRYRALVTRSHCVREASRSFLDHVFGGAAAPALLHLVRSTRLSPDEIKELQELLKAKKHKQEDA